MAGLGSEKNPLILRVQSMKRAEQVLGYCQEKGWKAVVGVEPDQDEDVSDIEKKMNSPTIQHSDEKIGRNEPCACGSGKKFKKCCSE